MVRLSVVIALTATLGGCVMSDPQDSGPYPTEMSAPSTPPVSAGTAARNFATVVARLEPSLEQECRARLRGGNCDFDIVVDDRPGQPSNAYQTLDRSGRPILAMTVALIADARNEDELAFILGHEAAHHIEGHIPRQQRSAMTGAILLGALAAASGGDTAAVQTAQDVGATVGARTYAKDYELDADALGTIIAWRAGFDPERGAAFFTRIPDPGDRFLGTHPPNGARIETVRRTLATLR